MRSAFNLEAFCRYALDCEASYLDDPVRLGHIFREYAGYQRTPGLPKTLDLARALGIKIEAVDYLKSGGTNMTAKGVWYIHYSAKDKPATQKFTIFHELFEIIHKNFHCQDHQVAQLKEPRLSQCADRFAASALIPPRFFIKEASTSGCDLVKLGEDLELSHQCLLVALGEHFVDMPFVGALYESQGFGGNGADVKDFIATIVVKTRQARRVKELCSLQAVPVRNSRPQVGSLICAAITGACPVLWRSTHIEGSPAILVRPLLSAGREPYRVILLAVPGMEFGTISSQVERIEPVSVNGDVHCPSRRKCRNSDNRCIWKSRGAGGYDELGS